MVEQDTIDRIRNSIVNQSEDALEKGFEAFFQNQPAICNFVLDMTSTSPETVGKLALYLSYVVYQAVSASGDGRLGEVTSDGITVACHETGSWIHDLHSDLTERTPSSSLTGFGKEPHLLNLVLSEVEGATRDGQNLKEEEKGAVLFVVTTVIASLTAPAC